MWLIHNTIYLFMCTFTIDLDPRFFVPPVHIIILKYLDPLALIFLKHMDHMHVINYSRDSEGSEAGFWVQMVSRVSSTVCMAGLVFRVCMGVQGPNIT